MTYGTRPDLRVRRELVGGVADVEEEALEVRELVGSDRQQAGVVVDDGPGSVLVCGECVCLR